MQLLIWWSCQYNVCLAKCQRYRGGFIGARKMIEIWLKPKVAVWVKEIDALDDVTRYDASIYWIANGATG